MSSTRVALIIIGTFTDAWRKLPLAEQEEFVQKVGVTGKTAGIAPVTGYRLTSSPGAFLQIWEGKDRPAVDRAVKDLQAMGYARYIEARFLIGERDRDH